MFIQFCCSSPFVIEHKLLIDSDLQPLALHSAKSRKEMSRLTLAHFRTSTNVEEM